MHIKRICRDTCQNHLSGQPDIAVGRPTLSNLRRRRVQTKINHVSLFNCCSLKHVNLVIRNYLFYSNNDIGRTITTCLILSNMMVESRQSKLHMKTKKYDPSEFCIRINPHFSQFSEVKNAEMLHLKLQNP